MIKKILVASTLVLGALSLVSPAQAASQCSGLSSSACSVKSSCTWRKSSVNKNGVKTKAHCRALPGKAKGTKSSTSSTKKAKASTKTKSSKKTEGSANSKKSATKKKAASSSKKSTSTKSKSTKKAKAATKKKSKTSTKKKSTSKPKKKKS